MNIPNVPTDNLYKFICISGVILIITCYISILSIEKQLLEQDLRINNYSINTPLSLDILENKISSIDLKSSDSVNKANDILIETKTLESNIKLQEIKEFKYLEQSKKDIKYLKVWANLGFFWTIFGFTLWYFRLQRYLDIIIKKEATK